MNKIALEDITLIMLAAGDSTRFCKNFKCKKQWLRIGDEPLWLIATYNVLRHCPVKEIFISASSADYIYMREMCPSKLGAQNSCKDFYPCRVMQGGHTRMHSLDNVLKYVQTPLVLVSDVARWNVVGDVIENMIALMNTDSQIACIAPFLEVNDTSFYEKDYLNRESLKLIQTPQLSRVDVLRRALKQGRDFTDESSAIHALGEKVVFVPGSPFMNKLTLSSDLYFHNLRFTTPSKKVFVGQGIDVHEFEYGKAMWLGGIHIQSAFGFKAYSDGDVLLHALCDAILGAIGAGDIGQWFPDTDMAYKGADSKIFLKDIYTFAQSVGYELYNADITIIAQTPKISPYKLAIRKCIADIIQVPQSCINIKATTTEGLGFVGRKEGICVQAQVSMGFIDWQSLISKEEI